MNDTMIDFQYLFENSAELELILSKELTILSVTNGFLSLTHTQKLQLINQPFLSFLQSKPDSESNVNLLHRQLKHAFHQQTNIQIPLATYHFKQNQFHQQFHWQITIKPVVNHQKEALIRLQIHNHVLQVSANSIDNLSLTAILDKSLNEIYIFDVFTLQFEYVNEGALKNLGYTRQEMLHLTPVHLKPKYNEASFREMLEPLKKGESDKLVIETVHKRKDNTLYDVQVHQQLISINNQLKHLSIVLDITEDKKNQITLRKLSKIVEQSPASIVITNLDGNIEYVNPAFSKLTGYTFKQAYGKNPKILKTQYTQPGTHAHMWKLIKQGKVWHGEFCNKKKNGELYWESATISPIINSQGNITHYVAVKENITDRKKVEREKEKMIVDLIKTNNELDQFTFIATHNLRAPLSNLLSIVDLLKTDTIEDERTLKLITGFKESTKMLDATLNDLLKILLIKNDLDINLKPISLTEACQYAIRSISQLNNNADIILETDFSAADTVMFYQPYLESIFHNLLTNSIRYCSPERKLHISIRSQLSKKTTFVYFTDNGLGIDLEKNKDKVFGLYQRFHSHQNTKGLGLYMTKSQMVSLGGNIEVESQVNQGVTFILSFSNKHLPAL
jgi:PAS domain S-box-containing protein